MVPDHACDDRAPEDVAIEGLNGDNDRAKEACFAPKAGLAMTIETNCPAYPSLRGVPAPFAGATKQPLFAATTKLSKSESVAKHHANMKE